LPPLILFAIFPVYSLIPSVVSFVHIYLSPSSLASSSFISFVASFVYPLAFHARDLAFHAREKSIAAILIRAHRKWARTKVAAFFVSPIFVYPLAFHARDIVRNQRLRTINAREKSIAAIIGFRSLDFDL